MSDLIERKAAIDAINSHFGFNIEEEYGSAVQEVINRLPPAKPKWIPCSERMPDVAQRVLLSARGMAMVGMLHSFGKYRLEPTGFSYVYPKDKIDAWMPLPEPYKENDK